MKHTPGPWEVNKFDDCFLLTASNGATHVAEVKTLAQMGISTSSNEGDIVLMAAAPDLLTACMAVRGYISRTGVGNYPGDKAMMDMLNAAIAKAEGQPVQPDQTAVYHIDGHECSREVARGGG